MTCDLAKQPCFVGFGRWGLAMWLSSIAEARTEKTHTCAATATQRPHWMALARIRHTAAAQWAHMWARTSLRHGIPRCPEGQKHPSTHMCVCVPAFVCMCVHARASCHAP